MLTQEKLKELLRYDPETGIFVWIGSPRRGWNGKTAGAKFKVRTGSTLYVRINAAGKNYLAHQLAWLYVRGVLAPMIDHIDGDGLNNSFSNLRLASMSQNMQNRKTNINSSSGVKGVHFSAPHNRWKAELNCNGRRYYLGLFSEIEHAAEAVRLKREQLHGTFANHG